MPEAITISTQKPANPAFDYEALRKLGIEHIEKTASAIWTDYNIHDPGITTLEILCYAITELSYRTNYSIPDILATQEDTVKNIKEHFISAANIFPNNAVTVNDYRKLLIDIVGIKNAWIKKTTIPLFADITLKQLTFKKPLNHKWEMVNVKGSYNVLLEFDNNIEEEGKEEIKEQARELLLANRNLCEDFIKINEVNKSFFKLCGEIEIAPGADPFDTLANIFFNVQVYLTPVVKFYWLKQLFGQKFTSDTIFEGPLLNHGFIKAEELILSELKKEVYLSDIMQKILQVDGVDNILDVIFNPINQMGELPNKWIIAIPGETQPFVDVLKSKIVLYKAGMPFRPDLAVVDAKFRQLMFDYITGNDKVKTEDINYDTGVFKNIGQYYSIQNHFPKNYGISHWGLPPEATPKRQMQAQQLRGYLYFFDQQLANFLSQLSHVRNLFSLHDEKQTMFTKLVNNFRGFDNTVLAANDSDGLFLDPVRVAEDIQSAAETPQKFNNRRNLFIDHLLSRFAESFFDYVNILDTVFPGTDQTEIIKTKINFLKNYPEYSSRRFVAYDYKNGDALWDTDNISGFEKRLQRLLGFENIERRMLVNYYDVIQQEVNESNVLEFWFELIDNHSSLMLLSGSEKFLSKDDAMAELEVAFLLINKVSSYNILEVEGGFIIDLKDKTEKVIARHGEHFSTEEDAQLFLDKLIAIFTAPGSDEGMYLVEHLLLLPGKNNTGDENETETENAFMPICVDPNCNECKDVDPYSFRLSLVLPAYAKRFLNMDFRRYCENVIRLEMPSHLFPKICWVSNTQLQQFEKAYKNWLQVKAGLTDDPGNNILKKCIEILTSLKSIYPPALLQDCSSAEERKLFLLNKNALGTLKT